MYASYYKPYLFLFFFLLVMPSLGAAEESRDSGVEENHSNI